MSRAAKAAAIALSIAFTGITVANAVAETQWEKNHPRRTQVNDRLKNQDRRINSEVREGEISKGQARELHSQDRAIRQEERTMSKFNNGHITPAEQKSLNQQENAVSREIGNSPGRPKKRGRACGPRTRPLKRVVCQAIKPAQRRTHAA